MGPNGLLGQLTKTVLETALDAEERADESVDAVEFSPATNSSNGCRASARITPCQT